MKPKLALVAATAVGALFTISVAGTIQPLFKDGLLPALAAPSHEHSARFVLAKNDHGHERQNRMRHRSEHDDDDDDDRDDCDDHHDDDDRGVTRSTTPAVQRLASAPARAFAPPTPAPARAVPPPAPAAAGAAARPANRLLGNGAPPKAQVN